MHEKAEKYMSDALDQAASAFDQALGNSQGQPSNDGASSEMETLFPGMGELTGDEIAGGDVAETPRRNKTPKALEDDQDPDEENELVDDEGEGDEDDQDPDGEGDEDDQDSDDADGEELLSREFDIMVDGEEVRAPLKEILSGYIRTKTFHKRMNEIDQSRKELQAHAGRVVTDRQRVDNMLADAEEILKAVMPAEPDWDKLYAENPQAARQLQVQFDNLKKTADGIRQKRDANNRANQQADAAQTQQYIQSEFSKFAAGQKWRDAKDRDRDMQSMRRTALAVGFTEEELSTVYDSRMLSVLQKASKYDRMMAAKPKPVQSGKTTVSPRAGSKSTARKGIVGAQKNLARSGSVEAAADVFAKII